MPVAKTPTAAAVKGAQKFISWRAFIHCSENLPTMSKANLQQAHAETYDNLVTNFVKTDDTNRPPELQGHVGWSDDLLWRAAVTSKSSTKRIDGKGIQRRGKEAAGILRKWMPFFKKATNGTGERASGDTTWEKVDLATLDAIFEWQLVTKYNDKNKRALKKEEKTGAKAEGEADDDEEEEDEEDEDEAAPV